MKGIGSVIAIGGNENKRGARASILGEFVRRAGGADARIVIIPSASVEPVKRAERYTRIFRRLGVDAVHTVHAQWSVTPDDLLLLENATGFFVTGGDQVVLMGHLRRTGCADVIVDAVRHGAVYAGTSAGASAVSHRMIVGSVDEHGNEVVRVCDGLGLVPTVIIDQHFSERNRLPRLLHATSAHRLHGLGVDEDTAVIWEADGQLRVRGAGRVTFVTPDEEARVYADGDVIARDL